MLSCFTVLFWGIFFVTASVVFSIKHFFEKFYDWIVYNKYAPLVTLGIGGLWFLCNVILLSEADLGAYKLQFFWLFGSVIFLAFFVMRELLAIRGLAVLLLLTSHASLRSVYCKPILYKNFFVSLVYITIIIGMLVGACPYVFRDFLKNIKSSKIFRKTTITLFSCCGGILIFIAIFSFHMIH